MLVLCTTIDRSRNDSESNCDPKNHLVIFHLYSPPLSLLLIVLKGFPDRQRHPRPAGEQGRVWHCALL